MGLKVMMPPTHAATHGDADVVRALVAADLDGQE